MVILFMRYYSVIRFHCLVIFVASSYEGGAKGSYCGNTGAEGIGKAVAPSTLDVSADLLKNQPFKHDELSVISKIHLS